MALMSLTSVDLHRQSELTLSKISPVFPWYDEKTLHVCGRGGWGGGGVPVDFEKTSMVHNIMCHLSYSMVQV